MGKIKNLEGKRFGKLTAIEFMGIGNRHYAMWRCICDCGNECIMSTDTLTRKGNHSCGCLGKEHLKDMARNNITHGMSGSRLLGCYKAMMSRCYRKKDIHYNAYGKRGIVVCDEWKNNKQSFIQWALDNGYSDNLTIDRIDVNGNYEPCNCRWIPMSEQYKNRQTNCSKNVPEPYKGADK